MKALELPRQILSREIIVDKACAKVFVLFSFITLTALGAYVRIPLPFTPVPITLQTFFVLLSGAVLGRKWGPASQASYLFLGLLGFPVFSGANSGAAYFLGPTGGYLVGFVVASWIVGAMIHQREAQDNKTKIALALILGCLGGIYLFGLLGLSIFLQCNLSRALALGFFPFVPGDLIKISACVFLYSKIEKRCRQILS